MRILFDGSPSLRWGFLCLPGDANGADMAVPQNFISIAVPGMKRSKCSACEGIAAITWGIGSCAKSSRPTARKGFEYYSAKDEQMTARVHWADAVGWRQPRDTRECFSPTGSRKKVVVYLSQSGKFRTLRAKSDLQGLNPVSRDPTGQWNESSSTSASEKAPKFKINSF